MPEFEFGLDLQTEDNGSVEMTIADALRHDEAYRAGLMAGWQLGVLDDTDRLETAVANMTIQIREARRLLNNQPAPTGDE